MADKRLKELGAVTVCGDLLLDRELVGQYLNGHFTVTDRGAEILASASDKPRKAPAKRTTRKAPAKAEPARGVDGAPEDDEFDPLAGLDAELDALGE